jgi:hypothetical protein
MAVVAVARNADGAPLVATRSVITTRTAAMIGFRTATLGLPTRAKQRLDELTPQEVMLLDDLVRAVLTQLADSAAEWPATERTEVNREGSTVRPSVGGPKTRLTQR